MSRKGGSQDKANDVRAKPAYPLLEAARYLKLSPATLRSWVAGRPYPTSTGIGHFQPLLQLPERKPPVLSFWNLVEAHVLRSLRTDHGVSVKALRKALRYAEQELEIELLLLRKDLCTDAGKVFLERYGELIELSASGQSRCARCSTSTSNAWNGTRVSSRSGCIRSFQRRPRTPPARLPSIRTSHSDGQLCEGRGSRRSRLRIALTPEKRSRT